MGPKRGRPEVGGGWSEEIEMVGGEKERREEKRKREEKSNICKIDCI